jgi:hypothetical protein
VYHVVEGDGWSDASLLLLFRLQLSFRLMSQHPEELKRGRDDGRAAPSRTDTRALAHPPQRRRCPDRRASGDGMAEDIAMPLESTSTSYALLLAVGRWCSGPWKRQFVWRW